MTKHMTMKSVLAGSALLGALTFGAMGGAGAATTPTSSHLIDCAKAEARVSKIQSRESKVPSLLSKAQAHEAKATANHHPKVVTFVQHRIKRIERLQARGERILSRIEAACGGSSSAASTSNSLS